jgi:trk system potassium uptake protein TrkA
MDEVLKFAGVKERSINKIMILGGGRVGRKAARLLEDKLEVKIIESDKEKSTDLADYLEKSLVIRGDGRDIDLLAQEGIIDMDAFISVTDDAETNIITCLMAKHLKVPKTIALVDKADYIPLTQTIGLDSLINKKLITANNITGFIRRSNIVSIASLQGIDAEVMEYSAMPGSVITKVPVKDLNFPANAIIGGIIRDNKGMITVGSTQIQNHDKVVVFALPGAIKNIEKFFK